jgi:hypothetical protein
LDYTNQKYHNNTHINICILLYVGLSTILLHDIFKYLGTYSRSITESV